MGRLGGALVLSLLYQFLTFRYRVIDVTYKVERRIRILIYLAIHNHIEATDSFFDWYQYAFQACKRLGNVVDPFKTIEENSADATRWYLITNASPWDSMKFDIAGIKEVQRKFFGTLYNTYQFFALYANVDGFNFKERYIPVHQRPEIDRWILSELHSLIHKVNSFMDDYEPTQAGRAMEYFLDEQLSNWYVRLNRRRFWKGELGADKNAAFRTLHRCLEVVAMLSASVP